MFYSFTLSASENARSRLGGPETSQARQGSSLCRSAAPTGGCRGECADSGCLAPASRQGKSTVTKHYGSALFFIRWPAQPESEATTREPILTVKPARSRGLGAPLKRARPASGSGASAASGRRGASRHRACAAQSRRRFDRPSASGGELSARRVCVLGWPDEARSPWEGSGCAQIPFRPVDAPRSVAPFARGGAGAVPRRRSPPSVCAMAGSMTPERARLSGAPPLEPPPLVPPPPLGSPPLGSPPLGSPHSGRPTRPALPSYHG